MSQERTLRKITFEQAMAYYKAPETFAKGSIVVKYRTDDVCGFAGTEVYARIDWVEKSTDEGDNTTWLSIHNSFATIADFQVTEYLLFEPSASQVRARIIMDTFRRPEKWAPTDSEISEIMDEQRIMNRAHGIEAA